MTPRSIILKALQDAMLGDFGHYMEVEQFEPEVDRAMAALADAGFVIVPREPPNDLLKAGCVALDKPAAKEEMLAAMIAPGQKGIAIARTKMRLRWKAMVEAALALPSEQRGTT